MWDVIYTVGWLLKMYLYYGLFALGVTTGFIAAYFVLLKLTYKFYKVLFSAAHDSINNHLNNNSHPKYICTCVCNCILFCTCVCNCKDRPENLIENKMSGAAAMLAKFDAAAMAAKAKEWEAEVADEDRLAEHLDLESSAKLAAAKAAYEKHHKFVEEQLDQRLRVRSELKSKISANKAAEAADDEYHRFVNSQEYLQFCQNLRDVAALDSEIDALLLSEQRKGRPPVAADSADESEAADDASSADASSAKCCECCEACPEDCGQDCPCVACEGEATDGEETASPLEEMGENPLVESQDAETL